MTIALLIVALVAVLWFIHSKLEWYGVIASIGLMWFLIPTPSLDNQVRKMDKDLTAKIHNLDNQIGTRVQRFLH